MYSVRERGQGRQKESMRMASESGRLRLSRLDTTSESGSQNPPAVVSTPGSCHFAGTGSRAEWLPPGAPVVPQWAPARQAPAAVSVSSVIRLAMITGRNRRLVALVWRAREALRRRWVGCGSPRQHSCVQACSARLGSRGGGALPKPTDHKTFTKQNPPAGQAQHQHQAQHPPSARRRAACLPPLASLYSPGTRVVSVSAEVNRDPM